MASFVVSTAVLLGIFYMDLWPRWGEGQRFLFLLGLCFLLFGYTLLALTSFGVEVPSPISLLGWLIGVW